MMTKDCSFDGKPRGSKPAKLQSNDMNKAQQYHKTVRSSVAVLSVQHGEENETVEDLEKRKELSFV